jgi:hypothetical protein
VGAGYSQGAAVMTASVKRLTDATKERVAGVVLYGNTRNKQENGKIPDFPSETYTADVGKAVDFLVERITAAGGASA